MKSVTEVPFARVDKYWLAFALAGRDNRGRLWTERVWRWVQKHPMPAEWRAGPYAWAYTEMPIGFFEGGQIPDVDSLKPIDLERLLHAVEREG